MTIFGCFLARVWVLIKDLWIGSLYERRIKDEPAYLKRRKPKGFGEKTLKIFNPSSLLSSSFDGVLREGL